MDGAHQAAAQRKAAGEQELVRDQPLVDRVAPLPPARREDVEVGRREDVGAAHGDGDHLAHVGVAAVAADQGEARKVGGDAVDPARVGVVEVGAAVVAGGLQEHRRAELLGALVERVEAAVGGVRGVERRAARLDAHPRHAEDAHGALELGHRVVHGAADVDAGDAEEAARVLGLEACLGVVRGAPGRQAARTELQAVVVAGHRHRGAHAGRVEVVEEGLRRQTAPRLEAGRVGTLAQVVPVGRRRQPAANVDDARGSPHPASLPVGGEPTANRMRCERMGGRR